MLIKSIIVKNYSTNGDAYNNAGGRYIFYDEDNKVIESGKLIGSCGKTGCETENFIVSCYSTSDLVERNCYNAIRTDDPRVVGMPFNGLITEGLTSNDFLKVEFKTPKNISKVVYCLKPMYNKASSCAHLADMIVTTEDEIEKIVKLECTAGIVYDDARETKIFQYNTTRDGIIETNISTNIKSIDTLESIKIDYDMPNYTDIRIAFSVDDRVTYNSFDGTKWNKILKTAVKTAGMTPDQINAIPINDLKTILTAGCSLDVYCILSTNNVCCTPVLRKLELIDSKLLTKEQVEKKRYIDHVLVHSFNTSANAGCKIRFFDFDNRLIESGNLISQNLTECETENFIVTCGGTWSDNYDTFGCYQAIRTDNAINSATIGYVANSDTFLKVQFKDFTTIKKFDINILWKSSEQAYSHSNEAAITIVYKDGHSETFTEKGCTYNEIRSNEMTPIKDLEVIYFTNECSIITNVNQLKDLNGIASIKIKMEEPNNTKIRFALSTDNRNTWNVFKNGSWLQINENDILNNGNTQFEIESIGTISLNELLGSNSTLDVETKMITNDKNITPSIEKIIIECYK